MALLCWQQSIHRLSETRISCYNLLHSNVRRQLASALSCQAKWWRRETEGKYTPLDVPCSLTPLLPWSLLNVCSIYQIHSTIVFQLGCFAGTLTTQPFLMNIRDPQWSIAEEWHIVQKKRTKIGKRPIHANCRPQDSEPLLSTNGNEEGRLKWYLEWTLPCRRQFLCIIIKSEQEFIHDPWNRIILKSQQG